MGTSSANAKNAPWNLHKTKPEAREVWQQFQLALDQTRTPCFQKPELYTDYDDPRFPEDATGNAMPSAADAAERCRPCPLLALCAEFAHKERPDWGTYGGERWSGGKIVK